MIAGPIPDPASGDGRPDAIPRAGKRLGGLAALVLVAWIAAALGPVAATARRLADLTLGDLAGAGPVLRAVAAGWVEPELRGWAANSAATATLAVGLDLAVLGLAASGRRFGWLAAAPALALAAGAAAIPSLLAAAAAAALGPLPTVALGAIALELSPGRSPGILLVLVLAACRLPMLARAAGPADGPGSSAALDAALLAGASSRSAIRLADGRTRRVACGPLAVAWAWAATDLAASWVLTPLVERQTFAVAALHLVAAPGGPTDPRLLGLFLATTSIRLAALLVALIGRGRSGHPGDWLAGP